MKRSDFRNAASPQSRLRMLPVHFILRTLDSSLTVPTGADTAPATIPQKVDVPVAGLLGFPPLDSWPSTQLQPLTPRPAGRGPLHGELPARTVLSSAAAVAALPETDPQESVAAAPANSGPRGVLSQCAAVIVNRTMFRPRDEQSLDDRYVQFADDGMRLVHVPFDTLKGDSQVRLGALIVKDLIDTQPAGMSAGERHIFQEVACAFAKALMADVGKTSGPRLTAAGFLGVVKRVQALNGRSTAQLLQATNTLRHQSGLDSMRLPKVPAVQSRPGTQSASQPAATRVPLLDSDPNLFRKIATNATITSSLMSGLMIDIGLTRAGSATSQPGAPSVDVQGVLRRILDGQPVSDTDCAAVFSKARCEPGFAKATCEFVGSLLEQHTLHVPEDKISGVWLPATALLLNLPAESLQDVLLSSETVETLKHEALLVLGYVRAMGSDHLGDIVRRADKESARAGGQKHLVNTIGDLAFEEMDTPAGFALAQRFTNALQMLSHNAERLELFLEMDEAFDPRLEGTPIMSLLHRYVPEPVQALPDRVPGNSPNATLALGWSSEAGPVAADDSAARPVSKNESASVSMHIQPEPTPFEAPVNAPSNESKQAPAARGKRQPPTTDGPVAPAGPAGRQPMHPASQPGAKKTNPAEHFHPRDLKGLSREERTRRAEKLMAVELGVAGRFDKWTPELRDALLEMRELRRARRADERAAPGGRLIQPIGP